jgi:CheY-like chemotaxis protein
MPANTWVKVVGFSDVERHSLNTMFRLSDRVVPSYALWSCEQPELPNVVLVDVDSYEGTMELESPLFNPHVKLICVGQTPNPKAWRNYPRPVDWHGLVNSLEQLFLPPAGLDVDLDFDADTAPSELTPIGRKLVLLVGLNRDDALYMRARLSLAGITDVEDVETAAQASDRLAQRVYQLIVVSLELAGADPWALVEALMNEDAQTRSVIVATKSPTWPAMEHAERLGCAGLLEIPFVPQQVYDLIRRI